MTHAYSQRLALGWALMKGWRLHIVLLSLVVTGLGLHLSPAFVDLPQLSSSGRVAAPSSSLAIGATTMLALMTANEPSWPIFATMPRRGHVLNLVRTCAVAASGAIVVLLPGPELWTATYAASAALLGEGLLGGALLGIRLSWLLPLLHLLSAMTFGAINRQELAGWAWILTPDPSVGAALASSALLVLGMTTWTWALRHRRPDIAL